MAKAPEDGIKLRRIVVDPEKAPESVHHFEWARSGAEFLLRVGYFDLLEAHEAAKTGRDGGEAQAVDWIITHRFSMSPETVKRLSRVVEEMVAALPREE